MGGDDDSHPFLYHIGYNVRGNQSFYIISGIISPIGNILIINPEKP